MITSTQIFPPNPHTHTHTLAFKKTSQCFKTYPMTFKYFETLLAFMVLLLLNTKNYFFSEAVVEICSVEKVLLEIS